jgi:hypothetical protein
VFPPVFEISLYGDGQVVDIPEWPVPDAELDFGPIAATWRAGVAVGESGGRFARTVSRVAALAARRGATARVGGRLGIL